MNWWSEAALTWLPADLDAYPKDFADRARPGTSDFFYYALDAFACIAQKRAAYGDRRPWIYLIEAGRILSPQDIEDMMDEWRAQMVAAEADAPMAGSRSQPLPDRAEADRDDALRVNSWTHTGTAPPRPHNANEEGPSP
jgi:hypothetical protein